MMNGPGDDYIPHPSTSSSHALSSSHSLLSPLLALLLSLLFSPRLLLKPHSIQLLPSHKINLHSVHLVHILCFDTMTYYSAQHTY